MPHKKISLHCPKESSSQSPESKIDHPDYATHYNNIKQTKAPTQNGVDKLAAHPT